jgi:chromosome segregation ATPase
MLDKPKTIMNDRTANHLDAQITSAGEQLEKLSAELHDIGEPASRALDRRLKALKVEYKALQRNYSEFQHRDHDGALALQKIHILLDHIEREESSLGHEANFLHQSNPSTMALAVRAGSRMVDLYRQGKQQLIGNHHPLGASAFVNQSADEIKAMNKHSG